ncbi:MAG TPA: hypothetical protein ENN08_04715 [Bacteroidales bacterium]|nr:hypothetical protein [Bacteroidales bacterium]
MPGSKIYFRHDPLKRHSAENKQIAGINHHFGTSAQEILNIVREFRQLFEVSAYPATKKLTFIRTAAAADVIFLQFLLKHIAEIKISSPFFNLTSLGDKKPPGLTSKRNSTQVLKSEPAKL